MEEVTLQVSHFFAFIWFHRKGCFKVFLVIKYTYVAYHEVCLCRI